MNAILPRQVRNWQAARFLPDLLQSIFVAEILVPSEELWLVSPWISDIPIINNEAGEFSSLVPEWDRAPIRLSQVLHYLVEHFAHVYITTRAEEHNKSFLQALQKAPQGHTGSIQVQESTLLHEKGLLGRDFFLSGSFNFTFYGISLNDEIAHLHTDPTIVAENRIAFRERWKEHMV